MICTNCKFWKENKCTDEVVYVDENGNSVCRYNPGAILSNREELSQEPAFPCSENNSLCNGMSKRFYAACAAMTGILSSMPHSKENTIEWLESILKTYGNIKVGEAVAKEAFMYADELLKQENE